MTASAAPMPIEVWPRLGYRMLKYAPLSHPFWKNQGWECSHCGRKCASTPIVLQRISDGRIFLLPKSHYWSCYYQEWQRKALDERPGYELQATDAVEAAA